MSPLPSSALLVFYVFCAMAELVSQAQKALNAHTKERDAWKAEADRASAEARKLKDKLEEMAYRINGMSVGAS